MPATQNLSIQTQDKKIINLIQNITESHILHLAKNDFSKQKIDEIYTCLRIMLNGNYEKYKFDKNIFDNLISDSLCEDEVQKTLSKLNEKQSIRKSNGVYYTPKDVVDFMVNNCFNKRAKSEQTIISKLDKTNDNLHFVIYNDTVFDPTCGTGEFLLGALGKKITLIENEYNGITDDKLLDIIGTIYGNDINIESVEIAKIRLFFEIIKHSSNISYYRHFAETINKNMSAEDFVNANKSYFKKYDIIIGNPPYVEDRKSETVPNIMYGNIYANVLHNSIEMLNEDGVMGFIIPISYTSTPRMKKIRQYIEKHSKEQIILNYADRPDCLFTSVHQKLSIIFTIQGEENTKLYSSGYKYWYKNERNDLFNNIEIVENSYTCENFYAKIGNNIENSVFGKVFTQGKDSIFSKCLKSESNVYLNMRACFWIKAFSFNPGSNEYKGFSFEDNIKNFMICLLNSSLFFLYWNTVSDCWHITSKELKHFKMPKNIENVKQFNELAVRLENKLEETKKYIGTKQTEYEYKHKLCKDVINEIDDMLATIYDLTTEELEYVKNYSSKYRESLGG